MAVIQMICLVAIVMKTSMATTSENDCSNKEVSPYQIWALYASKQQRYQYIACLVAMVTKASNRTDCLGEETFSYQISAF